MSPAEFDPIAERAFVRAVLDREAAAMDLFARRVRCIPRFLQSLANRFGVRMDSDETADVAQDVAITALQSLDRFEARASLEVWVYRICDLKLRNWVRARRRQGSLVELDSEFESTGQAPAREAALREAARQTLDQARGIEADILRMRHFENMSFTEVAKRLGKPKGTVKSLYYRGLQRVRERWREEHED